MIHHLLSLQESEPEYYTDQIIKGHILVSTMIQIFNITFQDSTKLFHSSENKLQQLPTNFFFQLYIISRTKQYNKEMANNGIISQHNKL
jgi:hypothetical protein